MTKLNANTKNRIANAIDYTKKNPSVKLSKVAVKFVVSYNLFYQQLNGRTTRNTHRGQNKALDEIQEGALKGYINFLIYINSEPNLSTIKQAGNSILQASGLNRILGRD